MEFNQEQLNRGELSQKELNQEEHNQELVHRLQDSAQDSRIVRENNESILGAYGSL